MTELVIRVEDHPGLAAVIAAALREHLPEGSVGLRAALAGSGQYPAVLRLVVTRPADPRVDLEGGRRSGHLRRLGNYPDINRAEFGEAGQRAGLPWATVVQAYDGLVQVCRLQTGLLTTEPCDYVPSAICRQRVHFRYASRDELDSRIRLHSRFPLSWLLGLPERYLGDRRKDSVVRTVIAQLRKEQALRR